MRLVVHQASLASSGSSRFREFGSTGSGLEWFDCRPPDTRDDLRHTPLPRLAKGEATTRGDRTWSGQPGHTVTAGGSERPRTRRSHGVFRSFGGIFPWGQSAAVSSPVDLQPKGATRTRKVQRTNTEWPWYSFFHRVDNRAGLACRTERGVR